MAKDGQCGDEADAVGDIELRISKCALDIKSDHKSQRQSAKRDLPEDASGIIDESQNIAKMQDESRHQADDEGGYYRMQRNFQDMPVEKIRHHPMAV